MSRRRTALVAAVVGPALVCLVMAWRLGGGGRGAGFEWVLAVVGGVVAVGNAVLLARRWNLTDQDFQRSRR